MTNILKLKNALSGDLARTNTYSVIINPPAILGVSLSEVDRISILAKSVTTPESTIGTITVNANGKPLKLKGDRDYPDITVDFRIDANMRAVEFLNNWSDFLVSTDGFNAARSHSDYTGSMIIQQLRLFDNRTPDAEPEVVKSCAVKDIYPISISGISYDADDMNNGVILSVSFAYTSYKWS